MNKNKFKLLAILSCLLILLIPSTVFAASTNTVEYTAGVISNGTYKEPTREGYTFKGWYTNEACTAGNEFNPNTDPIKLKGNIDVYPKWEANQYTITYTLNGGTNPSGAATKYTVENSVTLPTPTRTDYDFLGWYTNSSFTGSKVTSISKGSTGNKTFYAKWQQQGYEITLDYNNQFDQNRVVRASKYSDLPTPTREGYVFDGWYILSEKVEPITTFTYDSNYWYELDESLCIHSKTMGMTVTTQSSVFSVKDNTIFELTYDIAEGLDCNNLKIEVSDTSNSSNNVVLLSGSIYPTRHPKETLTTTLSEGDYVVKITYTASRMPSPIQEEFAVKFDNIKIKSLVADTRAPLTFTEDTTLMAKWSLAPGLYDANDKMIVSWEDSGINDTCNNAASRIKYTYPTTTKVIIPDTMTSINIDAFSNCTELTEIIIGNSVTFIEMDAFYNCTALTSIIIPDSVTKISSYAFSGCTSLTTVIFEDPTYWYAGASSGATDTYVDVVDPTAAAKSLRSTYRTSYWTKLDERPVITFTIDGKSYQAENGMTFGEWVDSKYNTDNYYLNGYGTGYIIKNPENSKVICLGTPIFWTESIIANNAYTLYSVGGSDN